MAEVGIHLENIIILMLDAPFEATDIGRAQSLFTRSFDKEEPFGEFLLQGLNDCSRPIGRAVVDDQDMELLFQSEDSTNDVFNVFFLVISRYNYNTIRHTS